MDLSKFFPPSLLDQSFGLCISPEDLIFPSYNFHRTNYYRPWKWYMQRAEKDFGSTISDEKEKFKIALDVQHFQPEEVNVKVADREIIIEGKHEERQDNHGFISRQFKRRYFLPHDCDPDSVFSSLSSDGVLTVTANKIKELNNKEIIVPIKMCGNCPNKAQTSKTEKKEVVDNTKLTTDSQTGNKGMAVMLREDHCCLLRPELLGAPIGAEKKQTKKEIDDLLKSSSEKREQSMRMELSEKMTIASDQGSAANTQKAPSSGSTSTAKSEIEASKLASAEISKTVASGMTSAEITETAAKGLSAKGKTESVAFEASSGSMTEAMASGIASAGLTETLTTAERIKKADALLSGLISAGKSEQTEAVACGITSEVLTEKAQTSSASKSEMCNIKSMLNETIQIQESSSSYSSSMASSIKETTEKISEIVNDISAQLKEAAENI